MHRTMLNSPGSVCATFGRCNISLSPLKIDLLKYGHLLHTNSEPSLAWTPSVQYTPFGLEARFRFKELFIYGRFGTTNHVWHRRVSSVERVRYKGSPTYRGFSLYMYCKQSLTTHYCTWSSIRNMFISTIRELKGLANTTNSVQQMTHHYRDSHTL